MMLVRLIARTSTRLNRNENGALLYTPDKYRTNESGVMC